METMIQTSSRDSPSPPLFLFAPEKTEEAPTGLREIALHPAAKKLVGDIAVDGEPGLLVRRVCFKFLMMHTSCSMKCFNQKPSQNGSEDHE
ncbi:hypothetical protein LXL04_030988 [Taraxacum kok-saghyz]